MEYAGIRAHKIPNVTPQMAFGVTIILVRTRRTTVKPVAAMDSVQVATASMECAVRPPVTVAVLLVGKFIPELRTVLVAM